MPVVSFGTPWTHQVFCFKWVQKKTSVMKWVNSLLIFNFKLCNFSFKSTSYIMYKLYSTKNKDVFWNILSYFCSTSNSRKTCLIFFSSNMNIPLFTCPVKQMEFWEQNNRTWGSTFDWRLQKKKVISSSKFLQISPSDNKQNVRHII